MQDALFGPSAFVPGKVSGDAVQTKRVLITVKAAPNPSERHGETVCVAGVGIGPVGELSWVRLYPINFRQLGPDAQFKKYDVVSVNCRPAHQDSRTESWRPAMETLKVQSHVPAWERRRQWIEPLITTDMCALRQAAEVDVANPSLALVRPTKIIDFVLTPHEGWTRSEAAKIDAYVNQLELFDEPDKTALEAPAWRGHYRWLCSSPTCKKHVMGLIDWEFVALQRHLRGRDDLVVREQLRKRWLEEVCAPDRDVAFYVGNQAKRAHVFSVLGVWWPPRM